MAWVIRRQLAKSGAELAKSFRSEEPADIYGVIDEPYDDQRRARFDLYTPGSGEDGDGRLPTVVWTHGGGFLGGSKEPIDYYLRAIAAAGFTVVGLDYSLAPGSRYPTPVRQVMTALRHLESNAENLRIDPSRFVLAGDCAGAQITAQVAAAVTNPGYGSQMGVEPTIRPDQLRGAALFGGPHDLRLITPDSPFKEFWRAVGWAYSGTRKYQSNQHFLSTMRVRDHVTDAFPPVFITAGNADPVLPQVYALVGALKSKGIEMETLFYPLDHRPPLPHQFQFDLGSEDGRVALRRLIEFFRRHTGAD